MSVTWNMKLHSDYAGRAWDGHPYFSHESRKQRARMGPLSDIFLPSAHLCLPQKNSCTCTICHSFLWKSLRTSKSWTEELMFRLFHT